MRTLGHGFSLCTAIVSPTCCPSVETLSEVIKKTLLYLASLLKGDLRQEYAQLLLKMAVINIYSIHHAADSHEGRCDLSPRKS